MLEHIITEIIMLRTVTNRGSSAVSTAPRVALRARRPTPRDLIAVHCAGAARLARRRRVLDRTSFGSGLSPPWNRARPRYGAGRAAAWRHLAAIALAHRSCLQDRLADWPYSGYFWLPNRNHMLRSLRHFWLRILNHFLANFFNRVEKTFAISG